MNKADYNTIKQKVADRQAKIKRLQTEIKYLIQGYFIQLIFQRIPNMTLRRMSREWFQGAESHQQLGNVRDEYKKLIKED